MASDHETFCKLFSLVVLAEACFTVVPKHQGHQLLTSQQSFHTCFSFSKGSEALKLFFPATQECKKGLCRQVRIQKALQAAKVQETKYFARHYQI